MIPTAPDLTWCSDVTYVPTGEGWLYLASVVDLCSRRVVGWAMGAHHDAELVKAAARAAVAVRGVAAMDGTIFHSDSEYAGAGSRAA